MTDEADRKLLRAVLDHVLKNTAFPAIDGFQRKHAPHEASLLKDLSARELLAEIKGRYYLTLGGLHACDSAEATKQLEQCRKILPELQEAWRHHRGSFTTIGELYNVLALQADEDRIYYGVLLGFLLASKLITANVSANTGLPAVDTNLEGLLYVDNLDALERQESSAPLVDFTGVALHEVAVSGYRPFEDFSAELGDLTVIIGANAAGKSSLFDFLRFLHFAAQNPLPPEIDPRAAGKLLFHAGGPERLSELRRLMAFLSRLRRLSRCRPSSPRAGRGKPHPRRGRR